jgi:hypothetical protein
MGLSREQAIRSALEKFPPSKLTDAKPSKYATDSIDHLIVRSVAVTRQLDEELDSSAKRLHVSSAELVWKALQRLIAEEAA